MKMGNTAVKVMKYKSDTMNVLWVGVKAPKCDENDQMIVWVQG